MRVSSKRGGDTLAEDTFREPLPQLCFEVDDEREVGMREAHTHPDDEDEEENARFINNNYLD